MKINNSRIARGEIYFADLGEGIGSEQDGERPVLIIQNNIGNHFSSTTIVALITKRNKKKDFPVHHEISKDISYLPHDSIIMLEQLKTIDKARLTTKVSKLDKETMKQINRKIYTSLGLDE